MSSHQIDPPQDPLGPYELDDIVSANAVPAFASVSNMDMRYKGRRTGLDLTEFLSRPPASWEIHQEIVVTSILEILSLSWLSLTGEKKISDDLRTHHPTQDLQAIYAGGRTVKVKIRFDTFSSMASFFDGSVPYDRDLKIRWATKQISEPVPLIAENLHIQCYALSRNFFERYRILALLQHIKTELDPHTPVQDRDIQYFIRQYLSLYHSQDENSYLYRRDPGEVVPPNAPRPGHCRYIAPVEIKVLLGLQADWLLAWALEFWDHGEHARIFDIHKWRKFCRKVRAKRRTTEGLGSGPFRQTEAEDEGPIADDARYLARYGADRFYWESKLAEHRMNSELR
ncbi:hypothetical protein K523DRAFT_348700 [Schizophyllum commune Tattone D]|nr:hypothetical protein K523DRAFT_348700 [Schizophyllum commune Tattone D]